MSELTAIRAEAFASTHDEKGVGCVASPIFDVNGEVRAALSVSGPSIRFTEEKISLLKDHIKRAALEISSLVGYIRQAK
ncbi:IclR family transcriptional regulator domain-containing protein [Cohnella kolymensis]|uniref:IclR family transcriptional regulator domain-containing protein n=1 Tax=Cohnella kolymensis TaxID=1590652 RepID=UPI000A86BFA2|nr:IclR family transcriptional regulator C-terminal domain-containing protein [Cohnella kolymensis]